MAEHKTTYFSTILRYYRKRKARDTVRNLGIEMLAVNAAYILICLLLESIWYLPSDLKSVLWYGLFFNTYFFFGFFNAGLSLLNRRGCNEDEDLLLMIGRQFPEVEDRLLNHFQLSLRRDEISETAVQGFVHRFPPHYFNAAYKTKPCVKKRRFSFIIVSLLALFSLFSFPALQRLAHPKINYEPPKLYRIDAWPQDTVLYSYDTLRLTVKKNAPAHFPVEILEYDPGNHKHELLYRSRDSLLVFSPGKMNRSLQYLVRIKRPHIAYPRKYPDTDTVSVRVLERPRIRSLDFSVFSPPYSGIPDEFFQGNIDRINVLRGSEIRLRLRLSETFGKSSLILSGDTLFFRTDNEQAEISWQPAESGQIILKLQNDKGIGVENDPVYTIDIEEDEFPQLEMISPSISDEILLNEGMILPYAARLQDDYGLSSFKVLYTVHSEYSFSPDTSAKQIELAFSPDTRMQTRVGSWEIKDFISPGSEIRYYFELSDNDMISGPKSVRSGTFYAKLPSLTDLFERHDDAKEETMAMLEEELSSTRELTEEFDDIREELLREGEMNWENKSALEENLKTLEQARKELENMQSAMDEQQEFMKENALFSDKVMNDFEQLQQLMDELIDDEMFKMIQDIQDKLKNNDTSDMEEILEDFSEKVKRFEESLDRMLEIFKRIEQEQRLEELGRKIKESLREQQAIMEDIDKSSSDDLAERQDKIAADTKDWEELGERSAELFNEDNKDSFDAFLEQMKNEAVSSVMAAASKQYRSGDKNSGKQQSDRSAQKLQSLDKAFSRMAQRVMQNQKNEVKNGFQRAFHQALFLSQEQERVLEKGEGLTNSSPLVHRYTSRMYDNLQLALKINEDLLALSKKTFFVDKALGMALGNIIAGLRSGIMNVEDAKMDRGQTDFSAAFGSMNRLARLLLERLNMVQQQQQGNAAGLEFYMQQLQQMAGQQQQLNSEMTQPGMNGSPGNSLMDQMARMAARQQALRRQLKQIQQGISEGNDGKRITGNLDGIAKDMEDVINQMRKNQVDRQIILRQEKIVQRLLDASRSMNTRDFKKERESVTGKELQKENPLSLPGDLGDHESLINMIRRKVRSGNLSPEEKRDMERYLESLLGTNIPNEEENR